MRKPKHMVKTCDLDSIPIVLQERDQDGYDLVTLSCYQCGIGFGAKVLAVLVFKIRKDAA